MKSDIIICADIETVKDPAVLGEDWSDKKWPPPIGWKVVAIGMVVARVVPAGEDRSISIVKSGCMTGPEEELIPKFWSFFSRSAPTLVTWNGRAFDVPVLLQRAFVKGIPTPLWFQAGNRYDGYAYRYAADWHCDLMDQLSDYGASTKTGMDMVARVIGLPGKIGGAGSEVDAMWKAGEIQKIADYCEADCLNLHGLYLRWLLLTGRIGATGYAASVEDFAAFLGRSEKPHHREFLAGMCVGDTMAQAA